MPAIPIPEYTQQVAAPSNNPRTDVYRAPEVIDTSGGLRAAANVIGDVVQQENERRDTRALMEYDQKLAEADRRYLQGDEENPGALSAQGRNAAGITGRTIAAWEKEADALMPKLRNPDAQARAERARTIRREDNYSQLWTHEIGQGRVADEQTAAASKATYAADAVASADSPERVEANISRLHAVIIDEAKRKGWDPETTAQQLGRAESGVLRDVVALQLTRDPIAAMEYFEANSERLLSDDRLAVEAALRPHKLDAAGRIQGDADWVAAANGGGSTSGPQGFDSVVDHVLKTEGGYVSNDGGKGPTNFGINSTAHPGVDVKNITQDQARAIYKSDYWDAMGIDQLPPGLQAQAFDAAVNQGKGWTRRALLEAKGDPQVFAELRRQRYEQLAEENPARHAKHLKGWLARVDKLDAVPGAPSKPGDVPMDPAAAIDAREAAAIARADKDPNQDVRNQRLERVRFLANQERLVLREQERASQAGKAALLDRYNNVVAKLQDGIDVPLPERPTRDQLIATLGEVEGQNRYDSLQMSARVAPDVSRLRTATTAEASQVMARYTPNANSDNYALEREAYDHVRKSWEGIQTARNDDPAAFLVQASPTVAKQLTGLQQAQKAWIDADPANKVAAFNAMQAQGQAYAKFLLDEQTRLGVPANQRALLPKGVAQNLNVEFEATLAKGDVAGAVSQLRGAVAMFGDAGIQVIPQLGKDASPIARFALEGLDLRTIETLAKVSVEGEEVIKKAVGDDWKLLQDGVRGQLAPFDATGSTEYPVYYDATLKIAAAKRRAGLSVDDATKQAASETINGRYDFGGNGSQIQYRIPRADIQGKPINTEAVKAGAARTLASLKPADISIGDQVPTGIKVDEFKAWRIQRIQRTGQWLNTGNESGLLLGYLDDSGRLVTVRGADGKPVVRSWNQLATKQISRGESGVQAFADAVDRSVP